MFEKEAEERTKQYMNEHTEKYNCENTKLETDNYNAGRECGCEEGFIDGAEFGYNKANEWHKVSEKLPEMDELVYLWDNVDDFPVVACRHIPYGKKVWVWDCKWGSGYTVSQLVAENYLWKEIVLPKE